MRRIKGENPYKRYIMESEMETAAREAVNANMYLSHIPGEWQRIFEPPCKMPYNRFNAIVGGKEKVVTSVDVHKEFYNV